MKIISPRRFVDQECQLFPWNLCAEFCAYKNSLRAVLRLSVIGDLSAIRARADTTEKDDLAQTGNDQNQTGLCRSNTFNSGFQTSQQHSGVSRSIFHFEPIPLSITYRQVPIPYIPLHYSSAGLLILLTCLIFRFFRSAPATQPKRYSKVHRENGPQNHIYQMYRKSG